MKHFLKSTSLLVMLLSTMCMSAWSQTSSESKTPLLEIPETAQVQDWYANYYHPGSYHKRQNLPVSVATDGDCLYIRGIFTDAPDTWIKGVISGTKVTFEEGVYLGHSMLFDDDLYLYGLMDDAHTGITADYSAVEGRITFCSELNIVMPSMLEDFGFFSTMASVVLTSDKQPLTGPSVNAMPYISDLTLPETFLQFASLNPDNNFSEWLWSGRGAYISSLSVNDDQQGDYLIAPAVYLEAGRTYTVTVTAFTEDVSWRECNPCRFEVVMGKDATPEALTTTVIPFVSFDEEEKEELEGDMTVTESGYYHIAVHAMLDDQTKFLYVSRMTVEYGVSPMAPDAVSSLTVTPGEKAAKNATITFTTPVATVNGTPLSDEPLDVCIYHDDELWKTISSLPGKDVSIFDDGFTASRMYSVSVVCNLPELHGKKAVQKVYVGYDIPAAPLNFTLKEQGDHISMKWDKVGDVGANGGYVDPSQVAYEIWYGYVDRFSFMDVKVADNLVDTDSFELPFDCDSGEQSGIAFFLVPKNEAGEGDYARFFGCVGTPYPVPFDEDFSSVGHAYTWYGRHPASGDAEMSILYSAQEANSAMVVDAEEYAHGITVVSPKITLAGTTNAVLTTDMASDVAGATVAIYIETPDKYELAGEYTMTDDWVTYECNVSKFADAPYIRLHYVCDIPASGRVYIDNIYIEDKTDGGIKDTAIHPILNSHDLYDLNGTRIANPRKGSIYIFNGKKVILK